MNEADVKARILAIRANLEAGTLLPPHALEARRPGETGRAGHHHPPGGGRPAMEINFRNKFPFRGPPARIRWISIARPRAIISVRIPEYGSTGQQWPKIYKCVEAFP